MAREILTPEAITLLVDLTPLVVGALGMALTGKQRFSIRQRDGNKCNLPVEHDCGGRLECNHILPQRYCKHLGIDPDFPENVLTICHNAHVGSLDAIHPDMFEGLQNYHTDTNAIKRVQEQRSELIANHEIYWNPKWDRQMSAVAIRNTQRAVRLGWKFPEKNGHKKQGKNESVK